MVAWSLADFEGFYDKLNIHFDLVIGESFYFQAGDAFVDGCLADGRAMVFSAGDAAAAVARLDARLAAKKIGAPERDTLAAAAQKDVGAVVIPLDRDERLVVRRADGRSIYATRDLGAVLLRREIFGMTSGVYVTGQEQQVHFDRVFRASKVDRHRASRRRPASCTFFSASTSTTKTGKKLSSRDSVANVTQLLDDARAYFRGRDRRARRQGDADVESAARELAIGSLVFNDLKQDIKGPVEIDTTDLAATISGFEKSGAAYVVYAACRARSILRRAGLGPVHRRRSHRRRFTLDEQEVALLLKLQQLPGKVAAAARASNPSVLVRHLLEIATAYNSYYTVAPVIVDGTADPARLLITAALYRGARRRSAALPRHLPRRDLRARGVAVPLTSDVEGGHTPLRLADPDLCVMMRHAGPRRLNLQSCRMTARRLPVVPLSPGAAASALASRPAQADASATQASKPTRSVKRSAAATSRR